MGKKEIFGPLVGDFNLNQCVTLKSKIKKEKTRVSGIYLKAVFVWLVAWGLIAGGVWLLDWAGIVEYIADDGRDIIAPLLILLFILFIMLIETAGYDDVLRAINKRIDVIGGLQDGETVEE